MPKEMYAKGANIIQSQVRCKVAQGLEASHVVVYWPC